MKVISRSEAIGKLADWAQRLQGAQQKAAASKALALITEIGTYDYSPWQDVRRATPEGGTVCLVYGHMDDVRHWDTALWDGRKWNFGAAETFAVTHWMRLPEVPEGAWI